MPNPIPIMGPIKGDMSIEPIMTAVEFTLSPNDATKMAKMSTHKLVPRKTTPLSMLLITVCNSSFSAFSLNLSKKVFKPYYLSQNIMACKDKS